MGSMNRRERSVFSWCLVRSAFAWGKMTRFLGVLALAFSLSACSYVRSAADYVRSAASKTFTKANRVLTEKTNDANGEKTGNEPNEADFMLNVVLRAAPRHLMVKPRTDSVWMWDRPGGSSGRAERIKKIPSGTPGKVMEFEPELKSFALWAGLNFNNHARQPVRWVKVATLLGVGWVRTEFIEPR